MVYIMANAFLMLYQIETDRSPRNNSNQQKTSSMSTNTLRTQLHLKLSKTKRYFWHATRFPLPLDNDFIHLQKSPSTTVPQVKLAYRISP